MSEITWHTTAVFTPYKVIIYASSNSTEKEVFGPFNTVKQVERCHAKHKQQRTEVKQWKEKDNK